MFDKQKFLIINFIIIGYFISLYSSQSTPNPRIVEQCSKWNISTKRIIFGQNKTVDDDDYSLNLSDSSLAINRETGEIAVLDDNNHRVLVFNQSNISTIFAILSDSSNLSNKSNIRFSPSAITYDLNNSIYIVDSWTQQIMKMKSPLEYGENATETNTMISLSSSVVLTGIVILNSHIRFNGIAVGTGIDWNNRTVFISDYDYHQIIYFDGNLSVHSVYIGNTTAGNTTNLLYKPTSIVTGNNGTIFVNDFGNDRIQMFKFNSANGTTLPVNISGCISLSFYSPYILVLNTKTAVYLFNLTNNETTCAIGCYDLELNDTHNALIDNEGNLIITDSNQVLSYSIYEKCPEITTQPTTPSTSPSTFFPINNCPNGTFGINCSSSENICNVAKPCLNSGICTENKTITQGYTCECPWGFTGINCENDERPCKPFTCFDRGDCFNISNTKFKCQCDTGYEGEQCEKTVDYCENVTCQNRGVCFKEHLNYTCNCLLGYSGRHCELSETSTVVRGYVTKSFGYIAILMLALVIGFIVFMDVLKYVFGIDPVQADRDAARKKRIKNLRKQKKNERPKVAYRFQYVN